MPPSPAIAAALTSTVAAPREHQNILFLVPDPDRMQEDSPALPRLIEMARSLADQAYVYFARSDQKDWEDDEYGVRYLPLDGERLPSFGRLERAFVMHDEKLAHAVATEHPLADVFLLRSGAPSGPWQG